ncbi:sulfatase-like hydrolase/transferase [Flavobacteriaceae bacterium]|nr:sulfatase-like hydrolase/transferase [Flavobacteriaceae bacterium]
MSFIRINEYKVMILRLLLAYFFYFIARLLFVLYNFSVLDVSSISEFFSLCYHGLIFDTAAIFYLNSLFVLLSMFPLGINTKQYYQKLLFYIYFFFNLIGYATNFIDFGYYKFIYNRTTISEWAVVKNEHNIVQMFLRFAYSYWHIFLLFIVLSFAWIYLYKKIRFKSTPYKKPMVFYISTSIASLLIMLTLMVAGIRGGDLKKSTRPINLVDANRYVKKIQHADVILNTPFAIIRTFGIKKFQKVNYQISTSETQNLIQPIKTYTPKSDSKPNIVLFITESYGREYMGAFNKHKNIPDYQSFTPFLDSLANHSLIFSNAFTNGRKSIHGMSSVLAGIPSFVDAYTSSPYAKQPVESLVSTLNSMGYDTSFFHGAPNGSMGFLGFSNILEFDHYYGKTEFNDDTQFDGSWGIWDEPFFQFMKTTLDTKESPFLATIFTVSSHEPYAIPEKYKEKFPEGSIPMHKCVEYTDFAFQQFFEAAKKEPWFENTIFVITADHCNQVYFDEYRKDINRYAVPIMFYDPKGNYVGEHTDLAQQIDIYPTILQMAGYDKPFRSWGRSLIDETQQTEPFVINHDGVFYRYSKGNYICIFDGEKAIGFYDIDDLSLSQNLIANTNEEMIQIEKSCKAFIKDYFDRIIDKNLK